MTFSRTASALALLCLLPHPARAQEPPMPSPPATATGACTIVGPLLAPTDFGVAAGQVLADSSAVRLDDGRVRLYIFAQGRGVVSAVSLTPEGASFQAEAGARLPDGSGMPRVVARPEGGWRLFYTSGGGIRSAGSTDGLTFTVETGVRITAEAAGVSTTTAGATSGATVTRLADGRYQSTSIDGLTLEQETYDVFFGNDPDALRLVDGTLALYYGQFDPQVGGTINLARCPDPASP